MSNNLQIAVVGGTKRHVDQVEWPAGFDIQHFEGANYGGAREKRALIQSIAARELGGVVILARWIGHSESEHIKAVCKSEGIPCRTWPNGLSGIKRDLPKLFESKFVEPPSGPVQARRPTQDFRSSFAPPPESVREVSGDTGILVEEETMAQKDLTGDAWKQAFAAALNAGIKESGVNQRELADILEIPQGTISRYTLAKGVPLPHYYGKLLALFPALADLPLPTFKVGHKVLGAAHCAAEIERGRQGAKPAEIAGATIAQPAEPSNPAKAIVAAADPITEAAVELSRAIRARDEASTRYEAALVAESQAKVEYEASKLAVEQALARVTALAK